tara:strand:+ start:229 stop:585 length:357 start_codon:yes stop_codon:yes gene_type:complete
MKKLFKKKIICFDIDGIICRNRNNEYKTSKPILKNISFINSLYENGNYIKIFTSRFMGRNKESVFLAKKDGLKLTKKQLKKWGVKYHKLILGKPSYDYFIDDKAFNSIKEFKENHVQK